MVTLRCFCRGSIDKMIFNSKKTASLYPVLHFDKTPVKSIQIHKYLVRMLNSNPSYEYQIKSILNKVNNAIGFLTKFQLILTIYKTFIRSHLEYGDVIYNRAFIESIHQRLEFNQYNAATATAGAIRWTLLEKLFKEIGLEILKSTVGLEI